MRYRKVGSKLTTLRFQTGGDIRNPRSEGDNSAYVGPTLTKGGQSRWEDDEIQII